MSDIFLSYASSDRERIRPLVAWLENTGWSVWWDRAIMPGQTWDEVLAAALSSTRCVVAVWSRTSVESDWVRIEASDGKEREILVPVLIDEVAIPLAFRLVQAASLIGWNGEADHPALTQIALGIRRILNQVRAERKREFQPLPVAYVEPRVLDAAISRELPVHEPADLIAMVRREGAGGLRAILEFDEEYAPRPADVASKPFELEFPRDAAGKPIPAELLLRVSAPDFDPPAQEKKLRVPPGKDSVVCAFLVTPQVEGNLLVQLEVLQGHSFVTSRLLRPTGVGSGRPVPIRSGVVVSMPLPVSVQQVGPPAAPAIQAQVDHGGEDRPWSDRTLTPPPRRRHSLPYMRFGAIAAALFVCITATYLFHLPNAAPPPGSPDVRPAPPPPPGSPDVEPPLSPLPRPERAAVRVDQKFLESKLIRRSAPAYPDAARRARAHGNVVLQVRVDQEGNVSAVSVLKGHPLLRDAAVEAVRQWKYSPTLMKGEPVPVITTVTVTFERQD